MAERDTKPDMPAYCLDFIGASLERSIKRLWILCVILAIMLSASWAGFLIFESQFEYVTETSVEQAVTQDTAGGDSYFVGGDYHGEAND